MERDQTRARTWLTRWQIPVRGAWPGPGASALPCGTWGGRDVGQNAGQNMGQGMGQDAGQGMGQGMGEDRGQDAGQDVGLDTEQEMGEDRSWAAPRTAGAGAKHPSPILVPEWRRAPWAELIQQALGRVWPFPLPGGGGDAR